MTKLPHMLAKIALLVCLSAPVSAQQQASVAILPFGALSGGDQWMATGLCQDLIEKIKRTPKLLPVQTKRVQDTLDSVFNKKSKRAAWLPASAQHKIGQWLDADLILTGFVGSSGDRHRARAFLDSLSIVPNNRPEGSEAWIAAKLFDLRLGQTVSRAFAEGSREGFFELQDALYLQLTADLGLDPGNMAPGTIGRPTESINTYRLVVEAENILRKQVEEKKRRKQLRRSNKKLQQVLKIDTGYAKALFLTGQVAEEQGNHENAQAAYGQASALDPYYVAPRMAIAAMARRAGDLHGQMAALQTVLEAAPWNDKAHDQMGQAYEMSGRTNLASEKYDRAVQLYNRDANRLFRAGSTHLSLGQFDQAIFALESAVARIPSEKQYHVKLVHAYTGAGKHQLAQAAVRTATEIGSESPDLWLVTGKLALETKNYEAAEAAFTRVLAEQPGRIDAQLLIARLRLGRGDFQTAIAKFITAINDGVPVEEVTESLAAAYIGVGQRDKAAALYADALSKRPNELPWLIARARILVESYKHVEAIPLLHRALKVEQNNLESTELLAGAYASVGNDTEAIRHYRRMLRVAPGKIYVYARLGDLNYRIREFETARNDYKMALEGGLRSADVYAGLGLTEEELSRYKSARTAYAESLKRDRGNEIAKDGLARMRSKIKPPRREPSASEWAGRGRNLRDAGDLDGAVNAFERSISRDTDNSEVWNELGTVYAMLNNTVNARTSFENAERLNPTPASAYNLGRLSFQEGKASEAKLNYQIALQRDETFLTAAFNLAALQVGADDPGSAVKTLQDVRKHHPENGALAISLANANYQIGELDQAESLYKEAKISKKPAGALVGLGNVALTKGDTSGAIILYREAIVADPQDSDPRVNLGTVLIQQGLYEAALEEFKMALGASPSDLALYLNLAVLYYHTEQYAESIEYCRAIIELDPTMLEAQRLLGDVAIKMAKHDLAVEAYGSALKLDKNDLGALLGIAETLKSLDRGEEARHYWQRWLEVVGEDPAYATQAKKITKRLKSDS